MWYNDTNWKYLYKGVILMSPKEMTREQKNLEKKIILDNAMNIVKEKGYSGLSMREVAKSCDFTATKIYYYFINKEHIVFNLSEMCFEELIEYLINNLQYFETSELRFHNLLFGVYKFCTEKPYYYELMFGSDIPKCSDFKHVDAISDSINGNMIAGKNFISYSHAIISEYAMDVGRNIDENFTLSIIARIIGVIQLQNSNIFREINVVGNDIANITVDSIAEFMQYKLLYNK